MPIAPAAVLLLATVLSAFASGPDDRRVVRLRAGPADAVVVAAPTLDRLAAGEVLVVRVTDGVPDASGRVQQCRLTVDGVTRCVNPFPVQFDDEGAASFQYQLTDPGRCDATAACVLFVGVGERAAYAFTVFGGPGPPPPVVTLRPPGPYKPGDRVQIHVASVPPGTTVRTAFCAPVCRAARQSIADEDGTATAPVVIGARCRDCGIVVIGGASSTLLTVTFTPSPAPGYDLPRLVAGLAAAALFLLLAWRIIVTVDWRPPSEAQTPELDMPD